MLKRQCPDRIRYQREHYACFDPDCKAEHDAEYIRLDLHKAALTIIRREEREAAWQDAAQKLRDRAEVWRLEAERWQRNAEGAGMDIIREQDYADRDVCLSKMSAAMTLAIEFDKAAVTAKEKDDADISRS